MSGLISGWIKDHPEKILLEDESTKVRTSELRDYLQKESRLLASQKMKFCGIFLPFGVELSLAMCLLLEAEVPGVILNKYRSHYLLEIIETLGLDSIIGHPQIGEQLEVLGFKRTLTLDTAGLCLYKREIEGRPSENVGWCILTSGSTGREKAVLIERDDIAKRVLNEVRDFELNENDRFMAVVGLGTDLGFSQLLSSLASAATLVINNYALVGQLDQFITNKKITAILGVPFFWREFFSQAGKRKFSHVRMITVSGASLTSSELKRMRTIFPNALLIKTYGQTETCRSLLAKYRPADMLDDSLGKPIEGVVLELSREGELWHRGAGQMLCYLGQEGLVRDWIKTGDYFLKDENGNYFYQGRKDGMVKIRGVRIFLESIESFFLSLDEINHCALIKFENSSAFKSGLVLFYEGKAPSMIKLKESFSARFPLYFFPDEFHRVDQLPYTHTRKIDRQSLLESLKGRQQ